MAKDRVKQLTVSTPQGESGLLTKESRFVFSYAPGTPREAEIALHMPIRAESYADGQLLPIFSMNRPEGWLERELLRRMAKHRHVDDMLLLSMTGQHQIGRLSLRDPEGAPKEKFPTVSLDEIINSQSSEEVFVFLVDQYLESGISGVQPKVLVPELRGERRTGITRNLIVKSGGEEYPDLSVNEFLCLTVAKRAGIQTPKFWLSNDRQLLVLERFDLRKEGDVLIPSGFEDMAVLFNKRTDPNGSYKYQGSYENIARMISIVCKENAEQSLEQYFSYVALSVLLRNGDAHLKNFGILYDHPHGEIPKLAPLFDVVTTTVYPYFNHQLGTGVVDRTLALKMNKTKQYPTRKELLQFGKDHCGVQQPEIILERIAESMISVFREHRDQLTVDTRGKMEREWESSLDLFGGNRKLQSVPFLSNENQNNAPELSRSQPGSIEWIPMRPGKIHARVLEVEETGVLLMHAGREKRLAHRFSTEQREFLCRNVGKPMVFLLGKDGSIDVTTTDRGVVPKLPDF